MVPTANPQSGLQGVLPSTWRGSERPHAGWQGIWHPKQLPNPKYFVEKEPFAKLDPIAAAGEPPRILLAASRLSSQICSDRVTAYELWTITDGITFSNILISDNEQDAEDFANEYWAPKRVTPSFISQAQVPRQCLSGC